MQIPKEIRRYIVAGWRHRWLSLVLAWTVCLAGWAYTYTLPNQYRTTTRVFADADLILGQVLRGIAVESTATQQVELLQRTLLSRPNLERIVARTGLDLRASDAASYERLLAGLPGRIQIAAQGRNLFTITFTDPEPRMSHAVVSALLERFMEQATSTDRAQMDNARTFVNQQIAAYESQLRDAERRRADFRTRYMELLPMEGGGGMSRLEGSRGRVQALRGEVQDATTRRDLLQRQLDATPLLVAAPEFAAATAAAGESAVAQAEQRLRELRLRLTEQHPEVAAARAALEEARANPARNAPARAGPVPQRPNPLYEQIRVRLLDAEAQIVSLERQLRDEIAQVERLEALARTVPQVQAEFMNMDRDYAVLRRAYEELLTRRESVQIAGAARSEADRVRLEVVDPPVRPSEPIGPNRFLFATMALAAGLGAGVLLMLLLVQFDRSFYGIDDLRKIGLPVLGSVSLNGRTLAQPVALLLFGAGLGTLIAAYGVMLVGGPRIVARLGPLVRDFLT